MLSRRAHLSRSHLIGQSWAHDLVLLNTGLQLASNISPDSGEPEVLGESIRDYVNIAGYPEPEKWELTTVL